MPGNEEAIPLREYVEMLHRDAARAVEIAGVEREKTAAAQRADHTDKTDVPILKHVEQVARERERAMDLAGEEREKAAAALRAELARAIQEGDDRLREHISNQITQIQEALLSADKLEISRIDQVRTMGEARLESLRRETKLISESSREAIQKAESATEKRFESVNEFRAQLASQTSTFMPRETAEARFTSLHDLLEQRTDSNSHKITDLEKRLNTATGALSGVRGTIGLAMAAVTILLSIIVVVANLAFR